MFTALIVAAALYGGWKAGRKYQKWRSGPGWHPQLKD